MIVTAAGFPIEVRPTTLVVHHGAVFDEKRRPRRFVGLFQVISEHRRRFRQTFRRFSPYYRHNNPRLCVIGYVVARNAARDNGRVSGAIYRGAVAEQRPWWPVFTRHTHIGGDTRARTGTRSLGVFLRLWRVLLTIFRDYNATVDKCNVTVKIGNFVRSFPTAPDTRRRRPMASSQDAWYLSLLGLAENFRTSNRIKMCIQCLQAVFSFKPPPRVEARTHLQLGNILLQYTKNTDLARTHLEQAVSLVSPLVDGLSVARTRLSACMCKAC